MKVDYFSDIHCNNWVSIVEPEYTQIKKFESLFEKIVPQNPSDTLIIAGDIGHSNQQNEIAFRTLKKWYKNILWTNGNHDLYIFPESRRYKFFVESFERLNDMINISNKIEGVHYLSGNMIEIDGVKFTGCSMWYDYSFGCKEYNRTIQEMDNIWRDIKWSDYVHITDEHGEDLNSMSFYLKQLDLLKNHYNESNVIVTHIGPDYSKMSKKYRNDLSSAFFYFDGENLLRNGVGKHWIYGHTHSPSQYKKYGCNLYCNPLGYPFELGLTNKDFQLLDFQIDTIEI